MGSLPGMDSNPNRAVTFPTTALIIVFSFCFHLSRFYLSAELCTHPASSGHSLQHCEDVLAWVSAPRAKLGKVCSPLVQPMLPVIRVATASPGAMEYDTAPSPPFHPPRILG